MIYVSAMAIDSKAWYETVDSAEITLEAGSGLKKI
jgi:hypothetical protein